MKWVLVTLFAVVSSNQIENWAPDKEYTFSYTTSILSGIPQIKEQYAGLKLSTVIKGQKFPDQTIRIKFEDSKFKDYNNEFEGNRFPIHDEMEDVEVSMKNLLEAPFKVVTNDGHVEKIQVEASEPEYITNIKKAAASGLLALTKIQFINLSEFLPEFEKMETSILGECQAHYTIAKMPVDQAREFEEMEMIPMKEMCLDNAYYEVIKTKDLKNCAQRPIYLHLYGASSVSDGSLGSSAPFTDESSVTRSVICGSPESYHLRKASNEHNYFISPSGKFENKEKISVTSASVIQFLSVATKVEEIPDVKSPKPRGSLIFSFPMDSSQPSPDGTVPQPDMYSAPVSLYPNTKTAEENQEELVRSFLKIIENASKSPESSYSHEDVAGNSVQFVRTLERLSLNDIGVVLAKMETSLSRRNETRFVKKNAWHTFVDLVSICGSNPCVKYIVDTVGVEFRRIGGFKLTGEQGAWIVANAIRAVKTPTEELLTFLVALLKAQWVQGDEQLLPTVAYGLTNLVHKACIHKTTPLYDYPVGTYGRFCSERSSFITRDLIPFLAEKLSKATNIREMITYINALGNLGHDAASLHLMKAIEGQPSMDPFPRSVAVYQLTKAASSNPHLYKPVILSLVENPAEAEEVRMAALTVLPYTRPTSAELNRLAVRTWYEPSGQVATYTTAILHNLAEATSQSPLPDQVSQQAKVAVKMAKPSVTGIQGSHSVLIYNFLDGLKSAVSLKLEYITSKESAFPRSVFMKSKVDSRSHSTDSFVSGVHFQGAEVIINKMFEVFTADDVKENINARTNYIKSLLRVSPRKNKMPEAFMDLKLIGLHRLFSFDLNTFDKLMERITLETVDALLEEKKYSGNFLKIMDTSGHNAIIPTECGLPLYVSHKTPIVVSGKSSLNIKLKNTKEGEATVTLLPVINYKLTSEAGVYSPFTKRFLGTGVDTSLHLTLPIFAEMDIRDKQFSITLKTPLDEENQKEKPVLHLVVTPYTHSHDMTSPSLVPMSKSSDVKIIQSKSMVKKEYQIGQPLGLSFKVSIEAEKSNTEVSSFLRNMFNRNPASLLALALPLKTVTAQSISLVYSPRHSTTKAASFVFSSGTGHQHSQGDGPQVHTSTNVQEPEDLKNRCGQEASEWQKLISMNKDSITQWKEKCVEANLLSTHEQPGPISELEIETWNAKCKGEVWEEINREVEEKIHICRKEAMIAVHKSNCENTASAKGLSSSAFTSYCAKKSMLHEQRYETVYTNKKDITKVLRLLKIDAKALSISMEAALIREDYSVDKKFTSSVCIGDKKPVSQHEESELRVLTTVKSLSSRTPYEVHLHALSKALSPVHAWDKNLILDEDLTSKVRINTEYGHIDEEKNVISLDITASRSEDMKNHVKSSAAFRKCDEDMSNREKTSSNCRKAAQTASSLDKFLAILKVPKTLSQNPYMTTMARMVKASYLPYITEQPSTYKRESVKHDHFMVDAQADPSGELMTVSVSSSDSTTIAKDLRLGSRMVGLLPVATMTSLPMSLLRKATNYGAPSLCSIQNNTVTTFDKLHYAYTINDCEHVIFRDCSESPKTVVTLKKTASRTTLMTIIDNNKYEINMVSISENDIVKINEEIKQADTSMPKTFVDQDTKITIYVDGVYEIFSMKHGLTVRTDKDSVEISSLQHILRNQACGLCGDLNNERTGDMKSAEECIMSSPRMAAYSYMIEDRACHGMPPSDRQEYLQEIIQGCVKEQVVPTKMTSIFLREENTKSKKVNMIRKHLDEQRGPKICFSKTQVKTCGPGHVASGHAALRLPFVCVTRDRAGLVLQALARRGEWLPEAGRLPIAFTDMVYVATACVTSQ